MAVFKDICGECGRPFDNSHVRMLRFCSVGCEARALFACPHGATEPAACDVCSCRGIWEGADAMVPPEDVARAMASEVELENEDEDEEEHHD